MFRFRLSKSSYVRDIYVVYSYTYARNIFIFSSDVTKYSILRLKLHPYYSKLIVQQHHSLLFKEYNLQV